MTTETPSEGGSAHSVPLEVLLAVQDGDTAADQLRHRRARLPERDVLAGLEARLEKNATEAAELDAARHAQEVRLAELAGEVDELVGRTTRIDHQLRAGEVPSFRDQEAIAMEMGALGRRRGELDDEQLVVMEAIEELEVELNRLAGERAVLAGEIASVRAALGSAEAAVDTELATIAIRRADLAAEVPTELLDEYERLRVRLDGVGVARLVNASCSGCHLALSATELDHSRHAPAGEVVHCAQCGRILVA